VPQSMHFMLKRAPGPAWVNGCVWGDPQDGQGGRAGRAGTLAASALSVIRYEIESSRPSTRWVSCDAAASS
jgi:hypothetical protein